MFFKFHISESTFPIRIILLSQESIEVVENWVSIERSAQIWNYAVK